MQSLKLKVENFSKIWDISQYCSKEQHSYYSYLVENEPKSYFLEAVSVALVNMQTTSVEKFILIRGPKFSGGQIVLKHRTTSLPGVTKLLSNVAQLLTKHVHYRIGQSI